MPQKTLNTPLHDCTYFSQLWQESRSLIISAMRGALNEAAFTELVCFMSRIHLIGGWEIQSQHVRHSN